jgi:multiple sugar transport system permease protein
VTSVIDAAIPVRAADTPPAPARRRPRSNLPLVALLLGPSALLIALFIVLPAVYSVWLSLTNTQLTGFAARDPKFIGLDNYAYLLTNADFLGSLGQTGTFLLFSALIGQTVLGMIAAARASSAPPCSCRWWSPRSSQPSPGRACSRPARRARSTG